jgi:hypothetical protein
MNTLKIQKHLKNDLMLYLKLLEKQEQAKPQTSKIEIIKNRAKMNEVESKFFKKYKESTKQKFDSLKREIRSINL